jgi:hypothetical protein
MELMLLFLQKSGAPDASAAERTEMQKFAEALTAQGKLRRGGALGTAGEGARVRVRDGNAMVTDGPFAEGKELVAGFWVVDVADRDEAIDIARRTAHARRGGIVEVRALHSRHAYDDSGRGHPFLLAFHMEPGLTDCDGAKLREMVEFGEALADDGKLIETAPLKGEPKPARIEQHGTKTLVTDGPFAEAKEAVGGYSIVRAASRADAIALAKRYPHARWGPVQVREIVFLDRV